MSDYADSIDQLDTADRTHTTTEQQQSPNPDPAEAYATEYRRLWDATVATLTAAVLEEARTIEGLTVPVEVTVQSDPEATWWDPTDTINPDDYNGDPLVWRLWSVARDLVPLPTLPDLASPADAGGKDR